MTSKLLASDVWGRNVVVPITGSILLRAELCRHGLGLSYAHSPAEPGPWAEGKEAKKRKERTKASQQCAGNVVFFIAVILLAGLDTGTKARCGWPGSCAGGDWTVINIADTESHFSDVPNLVRSCFVPQVPSKTSWMLIIHNMQCSWTQTWWGRNLPYPRSPGFQSFSPWDVSKVKAFWYWVWPLDSENLSRPGLIITPKMTPQWTRGPRHFSVVKDLIHSSFPDQTKHHQIRNSFPGSCLPNPVNPRLDGALVVDLADEGPQKCLVEFRSNLPFQDSVLFVARLFHSTRCSYSGWGADWLANIGGRGRSLGLRGVSWWGILRTNNSFKEMHFQRRPHTSPTWKLWPGWWHTSARRRGWQSDKGANPTLLSV